ncbi:MAG: hypothetical protein KAI39_10545 [Desulfobulbaceae bacterium]|nr:hypothetical protein [Desulfobulbaceae bacterium]
MIIIKCQRTCLCLTLLLLFSGCAAIGPPSVERDRFDYSSSIAESWKKMMLLNIIKLRYGDTPIFLEVSSIVNQYSMETELVASAELQSGGILGDGLVALGGKGKYADRPTITYNPLTGKKFSKSLLTPISPHALLSLVQSGWGVDLIFRICLFAINDLYNSTGRLMITRNADKDFNQLLDALAYIQKAGGLGARVVAQDSGKTIVFFRRNMEKELTQQALRARELLGLNPDKSDFNLVYGSSTSNDTEIAMLTRSMLDITVEISQSVQIPQKHIDENRASAGNYTQSSPGNEIHSRVFIHSSEEKPDDAFLAIKYRDFWFYIEDTDFISKRIFSFLLFLFTLAESGSEGFSPVITLPAG